MRYYSEETVKKIMTKVEVDSFPSNLYDTSLRTVERIYPDLNKFDSIDIPESPWHTGAPTEEGWYIVTYKPYNRDDLGIGYEVFQFNGGCWYDSNDNWTDPFMVAWQKIEPYKEKSE